MSTTGGRDRARRLVLVVGVVVLGLAIALGLGTSIENDRWTARADALRKTAAAVRFISAEPLLGPLPSLDLTGIDWLIVGGESLRAQFAARPFSIEAAERFVLLETPFLHDAHLKARTLAPAERHGAVGGLDPKDEAADVSEGDANALQIANGRAGPAVSGYSSHVRPSRSRPPAFGVRPPHCLKKNVVPLATAWSRS